MKAPSVRRDNLNCMRPTGGDAESPALAYLNKLIDAKLVIRDQWETLDQRARLELKGLKNLDRFLFRLADHGLLTPYQAARLQSGQQSGLSVGPYSLLDRLGAGTSSVVFKGRHRETGQLVALKVLIPGHEEDQHLVRFDTERRSVAQLKHPNIVRLLDVGEAESSDPDASLLYYYAMEFVPGMDLEAWVSRHGRLELDQVCRLGYQMASALHCAHQHGMVHRDVKPSNILWTPDGEAKLLDFGLARHQVHRHTQPGMVLGALEYIAPEQALDGSAVDIRADLFSLGSTLYFCLTGQAPFSARGDLYTAIQARTTTPAPSASVLRPDTPEHLDTVLRRLMALNPLDRFQTPRETMQALAEFVGLQADLPQEEVTHVAPAPSVSSREGGRLLLVSPRELPELDEVAATLDLLCQQVDLPDQLSSALSRLEPDIVLVDSASLPGNPLEIIRTIQEQSVGRFRKIVVLVQGSMAARASEFLASGIDDLLELPLNPVSLHTRLRSLLHLQEAQRRTAQPMPTPPPATPEPTPEPESGKKKSGLLGWLWKKKT